MTTAITGKPEQYGIGIDTGGTYTDSVIVELATGAVVSKAKALTTPRNLGSGIRESLAQLNGELFGRVGLVALSTTLATNCVVEGKGARVGLVMTVPEPRTFRLQASLPCEQLAIIAGAHNHRGEMTVPLDQAAAGEIGRLHAEVDAFAVSSYFSIYNAEHEIALRRLIADLTGKPTICAHELSGAVGMVERATTAVLNARLLPVIRELLDAVENILWEMDIHAPLMVVKGDGSMMSNESCRNRPVETVLSGPAASIAGACRLSGIDNGLVVDMGGTTTDIAVVRSGLAAISEDGARVGGWQTRVRAVDMLTLGLGGDSGIRVGADGLLNIGPQRVIPFSCAHTCCRGMEALLVKVLALPEKKLKPEHRLFYTLLKKPKGPLSAMEEQLLSDLDGQVQSLEEIHCRISPFLDLAKLIEQGLLIEVGFTPTDLLHTAGICDFGDRSMADKGLQLLARQAGCPPEEMQQRIRRELDIVLVQSITAKALQDDRAIAAAWSNEIHSFLGRLIRLGDDRLLSVQFPLHLPIIAVGAPVQVHLPSAAQRLSSQLVIPPHAEVANAYGAITGKVFASTTVLVRPVTPDGYVVISREHRQKFSHLREAIRLAREQAEAMAREMVAARGGESITAEVLQEDVCVPLEAGWGESVLLEVRVTARASGSPALLQQQGHGLCSASSPVGAAGPRSVRGAG